MLREQHLLLYQHIIEGIGLGLALTKLYVELMDIELESQNNVGTTFTLIFPNYEEKGSCPFPS